MKYLLYIIIYIMNILNGTGVQVSGTCLICLCWPWLLFEYRLYLAIHNKLAQTQCLTLHTAPVYIFSSLFSDSNWVILMLSNDSFSIYSSITEFLFRHGTWQKPFGSERTLLKRFQIASRLCRKWYTVVPERTL